MLWSVISGDRRDQYRGEGHSLEGSARSDPFESIGDSMLNVRVFVLCNGGGVF